MFYIMIYLQNRDDIDAMIASSLSGSLSSLAGHPADTLKVRMAASDNIKQSTFRTLYDMLKMEGIYKYIVHTVFCINLSIFNY